MGIAEREIMVEELKKHEICNWFWSDKIEKELEEDIELSYEPIGEMGVYSKCFELSAPYCGTEKTLKGAKAIIHIKITANDSKYNIQKAVQGKDIYHNVQIKVAIDEDTLITCKFRMWSGEEEEYCGNKEVLKRFFQN